MAEEGEQNRSGAILAYFVKAAQSSVKLATTTTDILLKIAGEDVVSSSKARDQLQSLKSKIEFFQKHERVSKAYETLLNDLPGVEVDGDMLGSSRRYVDEFIGALNIDQVSDINKRQLDKMDLLIKIVNDASGANADGDDLKCSISGRTMTDPYRNMSCGHVFDRPSVEQFIEQRRQARQTCKCPVNGCEEDILWAQLVADPGLRRALDRAYFQELQAENAAAFGQLEDA